MTLATKDWNSIINCDNLDEKVELFNNAIKEALDEIAPVRTFKVRSHHKFGLSDHTKNLMKTRDLTRAGIQKASSKERPNLVKKYELSKKTFINDGIRAWNNAPLKIKSCSTYASAKNEIKKFVKSLPI